MNLFKRLQEVFSDCSLQEARTINFNGQESPRFGWAIVMSGGAGSGKGYVISNRMRIDAKIIDVDELKKKYVELVKAGKIKDDRTYDFKNPEDVAILHEIIEERGWKDSIETNFFSAANKERLPNIIFDITGSKQSKLEAFGTKLKNMGYHTSLIWVVTNRQEAMLRNLLRERVVPEDQFHKIHNAVNSTLLQFLTKDVAQNYDEAWIVFGSSDSALDLDDKEKKLLNDNSVFKLNKNGGAFDLPKKMERKIIRTLGKSEPDPENPQRYKHFNEITKDLDNTVKSVRSGETDLLRKEECLQLDENFNAKDEILDWCGEIGNYTSQALRLVDYFEQDIKDIALQNDWCTIDYETGEVTDEPMGALDIASEIQEDILNAEDVVKSILAYESEDRVRAFYFASGLDDMQYGDPDYTEDGSPLPFSADDRNAALAKAKEIANKKSVRFGLISVNTLKKAAEEYIEKNCRSGGDYIRRGFILSDGFLVANNEIANMAHDDLPHKIADDVIISQLTKQFDCDRDTIIKSLGISKIYGTGYDGSLCADVFNWVRVNGTFEKYILVPKNKITLDQEETLEKWIDNYFIHTHNSENIKVASAMGNTSGAVQQSYYPIDTDNHPMRDGADVVKRIKKFYITGKLDESIADVSGVINFLQNLDYEEVIKLPVGGDGAEYSDDEFSVFVWTDMSHFGSAWISKPVVHIQIDKESRLNGYLGVGDIESESEFYSAINRLCARIKKKIQNK